MSSPPSSSISRAPPGEGLADDLCLEAVEFEGDTEARVNSLQGHALVGYYDRGWDAWFE